VLSDSALIHYHCTTEYAPQYDAAIAWNDPDIAVKWPYEPVVISQKDSDAPFLRDVPVKRLPHGVK
jgi:dTDP-4-dehydrorhamnose 3,5-epimerase